MPNEFENLPPSLTTQSQQTFDQLSRQLEDNLSALGERVTSRLLKDAERRLDVSLKELVERAISNALQSFDQRQSAQEAGFLSQATGLPSDITGLFSVFTQRALRQVLGGGTRTNTSSRETAESKTAAESFRMSRAQTEAELAAAVLRGQRNL